MNDPHNGILFFFDALTRAPWINWNIVTSRLSLDMATSWNRMCWPKGTANQQHLVETSVQGHPCRDWTATRGGWMWIKSSKKHMLLHLNVNPICVMTLGIWQEQMRMTSCCLRYCCNPSIRLESCYCRVFHTYTAFSFPCGPSLPENVSRCIEYIKDIILGHMALFVLYCGGLAFWPCQTLRSDGNFQQHPWGVATDVYILSLSGLRSIDPSARRLRRDLNFLFFEGPFFRWSGPGTSGYLVCLCRFFICVALSTKKPYFSAISEW